MSIAIGHAPLANDSGHGRDHGQRPWPLLMTTTRTMGHGQWSWLTMMAMASADWTNGFERGDGTGPFVGQASQNAWDRPVLGTGLLKCAWDVGIRGCDFEHAC